MEMQKSFYKRQSKRSNSGMPELTVGAAAQGSRATRLRHALGMRPNFRALTAEIDLQARLCCFYAECLPSMKSKRAEKCFQPIRLVLTVRP